MTKPKTTNRVWANDFTNLKKSLEAWENMSDEDREALNEIPQYIVHNMSRLAYYAKEYLFRHGDEQ